MSVEQCQLIKLPKIGDERGLLSLIEGNNHIPFDIKRIFYLYDVTKSRGAHAHKKLQQFIISLGNSFDVILDDGKQKKCLRLDKPWEGLYIPPMTWVSVENFQQGAVCLVLASDVYDESDYHRNYAEFLQATTASLVECGDAPLRSQFYKGDG